MSALALARREIMVALEQPMGVLFLGAFAGLNAAYLFLLRAFFVSGEGNLTAFFQLAPILMTFFAPALAMGALAGERRAGTLMLTLSWPVGEWALVGGKLLGTGALLLAGLLLTAGLPCTVAYLGDLDLGQVAGAYLGLLLLGGTSLSISLAAGSGTSSQSVAFLLGFSSSAGLYFAGRAATFLPASLAAPLRAISLEAPYRSLASGVLDLRDVAVFASVSFFALALAVELLGARRWR